MDWIGWLVIGFIAGSISGWFVGVRSASGCLPTIVVGMLGAVVGGWLVKELGFGAERGFIGALIVAVIGAIVVRMVLKSLEGHR